MPTAEIIREIDIYLADLRNVRSLLASLVDDPRPEQSGRIRETAVAPVLPSKGQRAPKNRVRRSANKKSAEIEKDVTKAAIALVGLVNAKVVVVSADQVRRERGTSCAPGSSAFPGSSSGGRLAFEALFRGQTGD